VSDSLADMTNPASVAGVGGRVARGASTLIGANLVVRLLSVLNIAVLARLLSPHDYGIMALAIVALGLAQQLSELQISNALIRIARTDPEHYATAFTLNMLRGCVIGGAIFALSDWIAVAMSEPALGPVLGWMALAPVIDGLVSPRFVDFARRLDFRREAIVAISGRIVSLAVAIAVALVTANYWALVVGALMATAMSTILTHVLAPWRPFLSLRHSRMFLAFGGWLTAAGAVSFMSYKSDTVLIGAVLGTSTVGQFNLGEQMATMATHQLATPVTRAIYSGLAQVSHDQARLRRAYLKAQASVLGAVLPIGVGTGLVAREFVLVFAGPKWTDAILILQVVAPAIALSMVISGAQSLLMIENNTRSIFIRNLLNMMVRLPMICAGLFWFGVPGVLAAKVLSTLFLIYSTLRIVGRITGDSLFAPFLHAWRSFAACTAMAGAVLALGALLPDPGLAFWPNAVALGAKAALGAAAYTGTHLCLWLSVGRPDGFERIIMDMGHKAAGRIRRRLFRRSEISPTGV